MADEQRVLIAESDEGLRRRLYLKLLDQDVFSDCAIDGREAIDRLTQQSYAVIILDLSIEMVDSSRVLDHIRQIHADRAPIVVAVAARGMMPTLDADTVQIIIRKPYRAYELAEVIVNCIKSVRAESRRTAAPLLPDDYELEAPQA